MPYLICSKSSRDIGRYIADNYFDSNDSVVIGVGGGGVIDKAKIEACGERCIAVPTTAAGASMTSHAVRWGKKKENVKTKKPILLKVYDYLNIKLSKEVIEDTFIDCLCHCYESIRSNKKNYASLRYATSGIVLLERYLSSENVVDLIDAGNFGGQAIEITETNFIHKASYKYTLKGATHGQALKRVLQEKGISECQNLKKLYMDIVQLQPISCT